MESPVVMGSPSGAASSTNYSAEPAPADLEQLAATLEQTEAATSGPASPGQAPDTQPAPAPVDYLGECRDVIGFAYESLAPLYPKTGAVYTAEVRERIAAAAAPLAEKYGFTLGSFLGEWGPEFRFALVAIPLIVPTARALAEDRADRKAEEAGATVGPEKLNTAPPADAPPPPMPGAGIPPMPSFNLPSS
jgi:hypothetical protein